MKKLIIPLDLDFSDLQLEITDAGALRYLPAPLGEFALLNGIDPDLVGDEDWAAATIGGWYVAHLEAGGDRDAAAEAAFCNALNGGAIKVD
jgi:hypothetical protein